MPLALLSRITFRRPFAHVMIVHLLSVPKKSLLFRAFGLGRHVDTMVVYASAQQRYAVQRLHVAADRVFLTPFTVDTEFFAPDQVQRKRAEPVVCTAGLEFRDYATLAEAARGLAATVVIAAASPWSKRKNEAGDMEVPPNVEVCRLGFADLRQLYGDADVVVMPLHDVEFQAGITTILEAMAMGRPVVCTRTRGQTDVIVDGATGVYVPPGDAERLRAAVEQLLDDRERATELGAAARKYVVEECDVRVYAKRLAEVVDAAAARHAGADPVQPGRLQRHDVVRGDRVVHCLVAACTATCRTPCGRASRPGQRPRTGCSGRPCATSRPGPTRRSRPGYRPRRACRRPARRGTARRR